MLLYVLFVIICHRLRKGKVNVSNIDPPEKGVSARIPFGLAYSFSHNLNVDPLLLYVFIKVWESRNILPHFR